MKKKTPYFPELDLVRFFVALGLILVHIFILRDRRGENMGVSMDAVYQAASFLLSVFFAQSGFLIAWNLERERQAMGTVSVSEYFLRRILRIWPLYFLLCFLVFFIAPQFPLFYVPGESEELQQHFLAKLLLYFSFLPQCNMICFSYPVPGAGQFWSIGTEEIFYVLIVLIFLVKKNTRIRLGIILSVLLAVIGLRQATYAFSGLAPSIVLQKVFYNVFLFFHYTRLESLFTGAICGILIAQHHSFLHALLRKKWFSGLLLLAVLVPFFFSSVWAVTDYFYFSLIGSLWVAQLVSSTGLAGRKNKWIFIAGKLTYGIYMFHFLVLIAVMNTWPQWSNAQIFMVVSLLTLVVASLGYYLYEKPIQEKVKAWYYARVDSSTTSA